MSCLHQTTHGIVYQMYRFLLQEKKKTLLEQKYHKSLIEAGILRVKEIRNFKGTKNCQK